MACHATGAAGAPKFGDKAAWAPRIKQGIDTLYHVAVDEHGSLSVGRMFGTFVGGGDFFLVGYLTVTHNVPRTV